MRSLEPPRPRHGNQTLSKLGKLLRVREALAHVASGFDYVLPVLSQATRGYRWKYLKGFK